MAAIKINNEMIYGDWLNWKGYLNKLNPERAPLDDETALHLLMLKMDALEDKLKEAKERGFN